MLRAASSCSLIALLLIACGDDAVTQPSTSGGTTEGTQTTGGEPGSTSEPTTGTPPVTSTGETTAATQSTGETTATTGPVDPTVDPTASSTSTTTPGETTDVSTTDATEGCTPGNLGCECDADNECVPEATCWQGLCEQNGGGLCPYEFDGNCDEGNGICPPGSDPHDCCATQQNGVCEEVGMGGECPYGSDAWDCGTGTCEYTNDGYCDEPDLCPPGTDSPDCCAAVGDGICEEEGMGGNCPVGSDWLDCGSCQWANDGYCDEPQLCSPGTDGDDCCATIQDGMCEEQSMGGDCPDGSDFYDCGYCPNENDGWCDEPVDCPPDSDGADCCATKENGVCEEIGQGGMCPDGSDFYDCGECPYTDDGWCDEPFPCPSGSDEPDCCATPENGVCEEIGQGGDCPDHSDDWDCGYCPYTNDGECDEPFLCPDGSDSPDCP